MSVFDFKEGEKVYYADARNLIVKNVFVDSLGLCGIIGVIEEIEESEQKKILSSWFSQATLLYYRAKEWTYAWKENRDRKETFNWTINRYC